MITLGIAHESWQDVSPQLMAFVTWTSFACSVARYAGDARVLALPGPKRILTSAELTWRQSLCDIEGTGGTNTTKLYAMGLHQAVRRSMLAAANERRNWRI